MQVAASIHPPAIKDETHNFLFADIGVAIFFSMDIADVFLAGSKLLNYLQLQRTSEVSFAALLCVWTYFRHWQNLRILYSVWTEYDVLVPEEARIFDLPNGTALCWWMKYQVFAPILALQFLNFFWYVLMWRIVVRMLNGNNATDVREEDEDDKDD
ncbi:sphingosine N-acyltransferase lag1 [Cystobasidiomycetes sp. EMM_F5]